MPIALIVTDLDHGQLGLPRSLDQQIGDANVLTHTARRVASIKGVDRVVLVHPPGQEPLALLDQSKVGKPVSCAPYGVTREDMRRRTNASARKWADGAWRGGLGQATVWDELLPAAPLARAMKEAKAKAAVIVGADWALVDPTLAAGQLKVHVEAPEAMKLTFTQAPPGLSPLVTSLTVLEDLAEHDAGVCQTLRYNPAKPTIDPIGREANISIPAYVRDHARRFIADLPSSIQRIQAVSEQLGEAFADADIQTVVAASADQESIADEPLPRHVHVCLTPRRSATGPITPQHHLPQFADGPDLDADVAKRLLDTLGSLGDATVVFGHHGEPTLHPQFAELVRYAKSAGVWGIAVETDLLIPRAEAMALLDLPVDLIVPRLNADTAEVYREEMGVEGFKQAGENTLALLHGTGQRRMSGHAGVVPWIAPSLTKVTANLKDMESFFERWLRSAGHAIIEPFCTANGAIADRGPVPMQPPAGVSPPARPKQRLTVLSDGSVTLCQGDLRGLAAVGTLKSDEALELWGRACDAGAEYSGLCWRCGAWSSRRSPRLAAAQAA